MSVYDVRNVLSKLEEVLREMRNLRCEFQREMRNFRCEIHVLRVDMERANDRVEGES